MNNKQLTEILKAMMYASGLNPLFDDDYYQELLPSNIQSFYNGIREYFGVPLDSWIFHFNNMEYMDSPSETLDFLLRHKDILLNPEDD